MLSIQSNYSNAHLGDMKGAVSPNEQILLHTGQKLDGGKSENGW